MKFDNLPNKMCKTITFDQGTEFADYRSLEQQMKCRIYYCEIHSPWQKGSNENRNGRLRWRLPREADIAKITQEEFDQLAAKMNRCGKGGLIREVLISTELTNELEKLRLSEPKIVKDRTIKYTQYYSIGGGKNWSDSFSAASKRVLGWSHGAHGLRHTYAQQRMEELQRQNYFYPEALAIVSQELGHFRPAITEVYLR